jgi:hypothetical protein
MISHNTSKLQTSKSFSLRIVNYTIQSCSNLNLLDGIPPLSNLRDDKRVVIGLENLENLEFEWRD